MSFKVSTNRRFVTAFDIEAFIERSPLQGYDSLTADFIDHISDLSEFGHVEVTSEVQDLPLLSFQIYGTSDYWWVLMMYNEFMSPEEVVSGVRLKYPALGDLDKLYFELRNRA